MPQYTLQKLRDDGPQYAMALLLRSLRAGEPFVTYGQIQKELEYQFGIEKIFPTHIGHVAGSLMNRILEIEPRAPLINVLITRPTGIPGVGAGGYLADRYGDNRLRRWNKISKKKKKSTVERERKKVFIYKKWDEVNDRLFGAAAKKKLKPNLPKENNSVGGRGGEAESKEHQMLKEWVANNPGSIGVSNSYGKGIMEYRLLSGDEVDVMFTDGLSFRAVEVKSRNSNDQDIQRGIYQCVKYREVKLAEHEPFKIDAKSILVTERKISSELAERAKLLKVSWKCVHLK